MSAGVRWVTETQPPRGVAGATVLQHARRAWRKLGLWLVCRPPSYGPIPLLNLPGWKRPLSTCRTFVRVPVWRIRLLAFERWQVGVRHTHACAHMCAHSLTLDAAHTPHLEPCCLQLASFLPAQSVCVAAHRLECLPALQIIEVKDEGGRLMNDFTGRVKPNEQKPPEGFLRYECVRVLTLASLCMCVCMRLCICAAAGMHVLLREQG